MPSVKSCCVPKCGTSRYQSCITLHSFPNPHKDLECYKAWTQAIGIDPLIDSNFIYKYRRVCHLHFEMKYLTWSRRLSPDAVPTLLLPGTQMRRMPLSNITNRSEDMVLDISAPSTSRDENVSLVSIPKKGIPIYKLKERTHFKTNYEEKSIKTFVKKLQIVKNNSYGTRLKKAFKLLENKTFKNILKKFTTLAAMFTIMQFREIRKQKSGRRFKEDEKIMALSLYKKSPKAYRWLQKIFVLPSSMTLSRLIAKANLKPGHNENIFQQLKKRVQKMKSYDKLVILLFDEISIAPHVDYNPRRDEILGFVNNGKTKQNRLADHALVFMIRGLMRNFKQPVAYTFCSGSTNSAELACLIKDVIRKLQSVGLHVLATVCDQGASNVSAIKSLIQETKQKYIQKDKLLKRDIFEVDEREVIPIYDPPHLLKGIRNNLLNKNLKCCIEGKTKLAKWQHIVKLYEEDPAYKGIRLVKKLTNQHINPNTFEKMKVRFATQTLSQRVAITMGFLAEKKILPAECMQTADVILFLDKLFDSVNGSYENSKKRSGKSLLSPVTPKSDHSAFWEKAKKVISTIKFIEKNKEVTVPSVKNWLHSINNIDYLKEKLFKEYNVKSFWMRHINQDPLENFFGAIRSHGGNNTNPTVASFESSFAALLINNLSHYSPGSNCEEDMCETICNDLQSLFKCNNIINENISTEYQDIPETVHVKFDTKKGNPKILASLQYLTGYLLKKTKHAVFSNCKQCNNFAFKENNDCEYLKLREYNKRKLYLKYPNNILVHIFSQFQDIMTYLIKSKPTAVNIKTYLKTHIYCEVDFNNLNYCQEHKCKAIEFMMELASKFFLYNWCKEVNKILIGTRSDFDSDDLIKVIASEYYKKRKHNKKQ